MPSFTYSIPPLLTLVSFLGLAVITGLRGRKNPVNLLFLLLCILGAFLYVDILFAFNLRSASTALCISRVDHLFIVYLLPIYVHFFHAYLGITRRRWLVRFAYAYAFVLMCFVPTPLFITSMQQHHFGFFARGGTVYPFFGGGGLMITLYVLALLYRAIVREQSNARRNRLKYLLAGFALMGVLNGLNVQTILGHAVYPPGNWSFVPLSVFAFGLLKHDLLSMNLLIKKSLVYSLLTALLTGIYAVIVIVVGMLFEGREFKESVFFPVFLFMLIAFVFGPLKQRVQLLTDRIFLKGKYDYQKTIKRASRMIVSVLDVNEIGRRIVDALCDTLRVGNCALFLGGPNRRTFAAAAFRNESGNPGTPPPDMHRHCALVTCMERHGRSIRRERLAREKHGGVGKNILAEMDNLGAEIVLPMMFKQHLNGFIVLGEKLSGDLYAGEDLDLLETLSSQSALAVENARAHGLVRDLNRNLEEKVEQRTRALRRTLAEKERTQQQLIQSESLAALGQLVAGVAHELNNPLASVKSLVQATLEDLQKLDQTIPLDADMLDDLRFADKELERARSIVKSLLGLSRQTQVYTESVSINAVVQDAVRVLFNRHKYPHLHMVESYCPGMPTVYGNFSNLGQVAINIIKNALQAITAERGTIYLTTRFEKTMGRVVFICEDTGPGISESIRNDMFKPFFTTKQVGKGTGLGLYICHEIVKKHGGTLTYEDGRQGGARFAVRLHTENSADPERK